MAESKRAGGLYYREDGTAVDAEGQVIEDAPKRAKDTHPSKQPGAANAVSSEERMGTAIADALVKASEARYGNAAGGDSTADSTDSASSKSGAGKAGSGKTGD